MEVEVKLRLLGSTAHQHLSDLLSTYHLRTHLQDNVFFDGSRSELSSRFAILRLRFYDDDARCVASLKAKARLSSGISRVEEDEEDLDPVAARSFISDPSKRKLLDSSRIMKRVYHEFGSEMVLVCLGGFRNVRAVYGWRKGLVLELDETHYDFGTCYEIECETNEPEKAKELLERFLTENDVQYKYSENSKFAVFRAGKFLD